MVIGQLPAAEAKDLLCAGNLGRLGCVADGDPYVVPVNYFCDGESVYMHSLPGKKINALRTASGSFQTRAASDTGRIQNDQRHDRNHRVSVAHRTTNRSGGKLVKKSDLHRRRQ
jgi:hypothetical protein